MIVHLFLLVGYINTNQICVLALLAWKRVRRHITDLDIPHLNLLLLKGIPRLAFAVVKCAIDLLASTLYLLANAVVFALLFAQLAILMVALLL